VTNKVGRIGEERRNFTFEIPKEKKTPAGWISGEKKTGGSFLKNGGGGYRSGEGKKVNEEFISGICGGEGGEPNPNPIACLKGKKKKGQANEAKKKARLNGHDEGPEKTDLSLWGKDDDLAPPVKKERKGTKS